MTEMYATYEEWVEDRDQLTLEQAKAFLEWGSCDGCGRHSYCAVCGGAQDVGHRYGCPVPSLLGRVP